MTAKPGPWLLAAALVTTVALSAVLQQENVRAQLDPAPSSNNGDPRGLLGARLYLEGRETSSAPQALHEELPRLLLLPLGPKVLGRAQVQQLLARVRRGARVFLMAPDSGPLQALQPALAQGLSLRSVALRGETISLSQAGRDDSTLVQAWGTDPLLGGGSRFYASLRQGIEGEGEGYEAIAGSGKTPVLLRRQLGIGTLYVAATPSLIENHRIDLGDNLRLLEGLRVLAAQNGVARKIEFDEASFGASPGVATKLLQRPGLWALPLQIAVTLAVFFFGFARRFGALRLLRPLPSHDGARHLRSLASLYARSGVEAELCQQLHRSLRLRLWQAQGLSLSLSDSRVAALAAERLPISAQALEKALASCLSAHANRAQFHAIVRSCAVLEARLAPRSVA